MTKSNTLKITRTILKLKHTNVINTHQIITDFNRLKINNIRNSEQTIPLNKFCARLTQLNLIPFALNSTPRLTVHSYLNTLEYTGRVESRKGLWYAKAGEQTIKPLEKEIVIELPMPKNQWQRMALIEALANEAKESGLPRTGNIYRTFLENFRETRTIKIKGKNVDDLDLEKLGNLIQQANEKSSKVNLRGFFKSLKKSQPENKEPSF